MADSSAESAACAATEPEPEEPSPATASSPTDAAEPSQGSGGPAADAEGEQDLPPTVAAMATAAVGLAAPASAVSAAASATTCSEPPTSSCSTTPAAAPATPTDAAESAAPSDASASASAASGEEASALPRGSFHAASKHRRSSSTTNLPSSRRSSQPTSSLSTAAAKPPPTVEDEVAGLTLLTLTDTREPKSREVSYKNADIPDMLYETPPRPTAGAAAGAAGARASIAAPLWADSAAINSLRVQGHRRQRSNSDPLKFFRDGEHQREHQKQALAYWKLEKELRLAKDKLMVKAEECASLSQYKDQLTAEMDDLAASLFEQAHEMVRQEKMARFQAEKQLKEERSKSEVQDEELKALKTIVAHMHDTNAQRAYVEQPLNAVKEKEKRRKGSFNKKRLSRELAAPSPPGAAGGEAAGTAGGRPDPSPVLLKEFVDWLAKPSLDADSAFMQRVLAEDVGLCMNFPGSAELAAKLLAGVQQNTILIEMLPKPAEGPCALCCSATPCAFQVKDQASADWAVVCRHSRNKVVAVCDFYMYMRHICQGLVKAAPDDVFWRVCNLRLAMSRARLGLELN